MYVRCFSPSAGQLGGHENENQSAKKVVVAKQKENNQLFVAEKIYRYKHINSPSSDLQTETPNNELSYLEPELTQVEGNFELIFQYFEREPYTHNKKQ